MSRRLGYSFNQVYRWETGRTVLLWNDFVRLSQSCHRDVAEILKRSLMLEVRSDNGATLLRTILGNRTVSEAAQLLGRSSHQVGHWLAGRSQVPFTGILEALLKCIPFALDIVADIVAPATLPALSSLQERRARQLQITRRFPFSGLLIEALELSAMLGIRGPRLQRWLSDSLGILPEEIQRALQELEEAGLIAHANDGPISTRERVNLGRDYAVACTVRAWWLRRAADTLQNLPAPPKRSYFGYIGFSVSPGAHEKLRSLSRAFIENVWDVVREDEERIEALVSQGTPEAIANEAETRALCTLSLALLDMGEQGRTNLENDNQNGNPNIA